MAAAGKQKISYGIWKKILTLPGLAPQKIMPVLISCFHRSIGASEHRSIEASKHRSIEASKHRSIKASKHQSIKASKHQSIKASKDQSITVFQWLDALMFQRHSGAMH
jgi:hypothetical protein